MSAMHLGSAGEALIKSYEKFRPTAYLPTPRDVWTIGWSHTHGVKQGDICTLDEAEVFFQQDVASVVATVNSDVLVCISQNQFDALVSLAFNIGGAAFAGSTLLRRLNDGAMIAAASQFAVWNKQAGRVLPGLVARRGAEAALFLRA